MPTTLTARRDDVVVTAPDRSTAYVASAYARRVRRPVAVTLEPTVEAVRDTLAHVGEGEIISVPVGEPLDNFDIVEWCARNRKHVINRFDPWPLEYLVIENTPA